MFPSTQRQPSSECGHEDTAHQLAVHADGSTRLLFPQEDVDAIAKGVDALNAHPIKPAGRPELLWRDRASLLGQTMRTHGPAMKTLFFGADELEQWCVVPSDGERRRPADRERTSSPTLQTLQEPILLQPWVCVRGGGFANPNPDSKAARATQDGHGARRGVRDARGHVHPDAQQLGR